MASRCLAEIPYVGTFRSLIKSLEALIFHGGASPYLHRHVDEKHRMLGKIFCEKVGPVTAVFLSDPNHYRTVFAHEGKFPVHVLPEAWSVYNEIHGCQRGLFFMDGDQWYKTRKILSNVLLRSQTAIESLDWMRNACHAVSHKLTPHIASEKLDIFFYKWSLNVILAILVGAQQFQQISNQIEERVNRLASQIYRIFETTAHLTHVPSRLAAKYRLKRWRLFEETVTQTLCESRKFVLLLIQQVEQDRLNNDDGLLTKILGLLPTDVVVKVVTDLVLAASDTSAYSMQWLVYSLSRNQHVQQRLRYEQEDSVYMKNVIRECFRLYPVAPFLTRILPTDLILEDKYFIPKNTPIVMSLYTSGRDSSIFINPDVFEPNRWLRSNPYYQNNMQLASLPFAMGARSCIGRRIADLQLSVGLSSVVRMFEIQADDHRNVDMVLKMVAVPERPVRVKFHPLS